MGRILGRDWERSGWHYVNIDAVFDQLLPGSQRTMQDRMLAYDAAHAVGRSLFEHGRVPILECTYSRRGQRTSLVRAIEGLSSASLRVVEFSLPVDEAARRFRASAGHQATDLTEQLVRERTATYPYSPDTLRLRSDTASPAALAQRIRDWLLARPTPVDPGRWAALGNP